MVQVRIGISGEDMSEFLANTLNDPASCLSHESFCTVSPMSVLPKWEWEFSYMCLVTSFGVCALPECPYTVFNITPMKWDHVRQGLMKHIWGLHFALFPSKESSWSGPHAGYEKNLTSWGSARKVHSNIIFWLTLITLLKTKMLGGYLFSTLNQCLRNCADERNLSLPCSDGWLYRNTFTQLQEHIW